MADNLALKNDDTTEVGTLALDEVTYSGDTAYVGLTRLVGVSGAEGAKTVVEVVGQQAMTQSFSIVPASDITDATYIGDIKFGESLPTGSNTVGEVTIGAATTDAADLAKAEDAIHASGDVGVMSLAVRMDTLTGVAADGDYVPLYSVGGRLWTANILEEQHDDVFGVGSKGYSPDR